MNGSGVTNLQVNGQPVALTAPTTKVTLGDWGQLTIGSAAVDRSAPDGAKGYRGFVTEIDVHLTADHGGLPANSEIQIGYADAAAQTRRRPQRRRPTTTTDTHRRSRRRSPMSRAPTRHVTGHGAAGHRAASGR